MPASPNPFTRADTLIGTCQAIGDDFGVSPLLLRVAFALGLFVSLKWTMVAYLTLGALVLASRLIFPTRQATPDAMASTTAAGDNDAAEDELPLAA